MNLSGGFRAVGGGSAVGGFSYRGGDGGMWLCLCSVSDPDKRLQALWVVCDNLPKSNKANLRSVATCRRSVGLFSHSSLTPP